MSNVTLTIYNPQQISVMAEVYLPGQSVQTNLLAAGAQWQVTGASSGQWVAFSDPQTGQLWAAAVLPDGSTIAQLLLDMGISGLLRMNAQEPLTAENGLSTEVVIQLQDVGTAAPTIQKLAPRGQTGSSANFTYAARGQWLGFYDTAGNYITGTPADSFSMVTLLAPRQTFEIGTPYPVSSAAVQGTAPEGQVRITRPAAQKAG